MDINSKDNNAGCILNLHSNKLTFESVVVLQKKIKELPTNKSVALNMKNVDFICIEFLDFLKESARLKRVSLTCLQAEILVLLNLIQYDKFAPIFLTDSDFLNQKRELLNRRFLVV